MANLARMPQGLICRRLTAKQLFSLLLQVSAIPSTSIRDSPFPLHSTFQGEVIPHLWLPMPRQDVAISFHSVLARQGRDALATALALGILLSHLRKRQSLDWRMSAFRCGPSSRNAMGRQMT